MKTLIVLELGKLFASRGRKVLSAVYLILLAVASVVTATISASSGIELSIEILEAALIVSGLFVPILVILVFAGEWVSGPMHFTSLISPRRSRIWVAKALISLLAAVACTLIGFISMAATPAVVSAFGSGAGAGPAIIDARIFAPAVQHISPLFLHTLLAVALGTLILQIPIAMGMFFLATSALDGLLSLALKDNAAWLQYDAAVVQISRGNWEVPSLTALLIWVVGLGVAGFFRFSRRDLA